MKSEFSVVVPLYNKEREIAATLRSVLAQTLLPQEILVIDDGSTDASAAEAEAIGSPLVRLIRQPNGGVSAARNRGLREARCEWVALLDGDDRWHPGYLRRMAELIERYPGCGAYASGFRIHSGSDRYTVADTPRTEGPVDFFAEALRRYVLIPSTATLRRETALRLGGFPVGMKLGEDQWFWTRLARTAPVCFTPEPLADYSRTAGNRSAAIYTPEQTDHSFEELYDPAATDLSNEYIARAALGKALTICAKGGTEEARRVVRFFAYTRSSRRILRKVRVLCALPAEWRQPLLNCYNRMAWLLAHKGL